MNDKLKRVIREELKEIFSDLEKEEILTEPSKDMNSYLSRKLNTIDYKKLMEKLNG